MSADQCYILQGWGSTVNAAGRLVAKPCVGSNYGASEQIYGVAAHPCQVSLLHATSKLPAMAWDRLNTLQMSYPLKAV
jgi:hypothetical protein